MQENRRQHLKYLQCHVLACLELYVSETERQEVTWCQVKNWDLRSYVFHSCLVGAGMVRWRKWYTMITSTSFDWSVIYFSETYHPSSLEELMVVTLSNAIMQRWMRKQIVYITFWVGHIWVWIKCSDCRAAWSTFSRTCYLLMFRVEIPSWQYFYFIQKYFRSNQKCATMCCFPNKSSHGTSLRCK